MSRREPPPRREAQSYEDVSYAPSRSHQNDSRNSERDFGRDRRDEYRRDDRDYNRNDSGRDRRDDYRREGNYRNDERRDNRNRSRSPRRRDDHRRDSDRNHSSRENDSRSDRDRNSRRSASPEVSRTGERSPPPPPRASIPDPPRNDSKRHGESRSELRGGREKESKLDESRRQEKEKAEREAAGIEEDEMEEDDGGDAEAMAAMFGFAGFGSTKSKQVQVDMAAVEIKKPRVHRQYMNRKGGFNRPLERMK